MEKIKKVKASVDKSLEKVQKKTWAEPLGKTLAVTGKIVNGCGSFIPGAGIIAGALSFGSGLLNPEPSLQDLKKQLDALNIGIESISTDNASVRSIIEESMKKEIEKLEAKIANPPSEIRSDIEKIKSEMVDTMKEIKQNNDCILNEVSSIKDITSKTFNLVTDIRYKVCKLGVSPSLVSSSTFKSSNTNETLDHTPL